MAGAGLSRRARSWGLGRWTVLVLVLVAFGLGTYNLGAREFWLDEALSANVSGLGWAGATAHLRSSPFEHPPFYFLSLNLWQQGAGTTEFTLRFFSLLWGVLFIPLLYAFTKRLSGERLGVLAALLATISPFMVAYSQEARMYTMLPCLALLALLAFWNGLERDDRPLWWLAYLAIVILGASTHYLFILVWIATTLYLVLDFLQRRKVRWWAVAVQGLPLLAAGIWLIFSPGLRDSLSRIARGEAAFGLAYKLNKIMPTLLLAEMEAQQPPPGAYLLMALGWLLILLGVWWSKRKRVLGERAWLLLVLILVVPLGVALAIPYGVLGRHLGLVLIPGFIFMALGLLALHRRGLLALGVGVLTVLSLSSLGLIAHYTSTGGSFGQALAYIDQRGQPGDSVIISQPLHQHLAAYYNEQEWPIQYLPPANSPPTVDRVDEALDALNKLHDRLWLGPAGAWTADPESLVEQWLVANAFQAEKVWFSDSSAVALYLTSREGLVPLEAGNWNWEGQIGLNGVEASPLSVRVGDALRLRFRWRAAQGIDGRYEVSLRLVDDQGLVWAERRSEPCGGWCPTDEWQGSAFVQDQHALVIPPGTPPGAYLLEVAWIPLDGGPSLHAERDGDHVDRISLAEVTILPDGPSQGPWDLPNPLQVTFDGEVALLGYEPALAQVQQGGDLLLWTHWRAERTPSADYTLVTELVDESGRVAATWPAVLLPSYPSSLWQQGQYLRGQQRLHLPAALPPGHHTLRIALVSPEGARLQASGQAAKPARLRDGDLLLATVEVLDRPRQFGLPPVTNALDATVGKQAHLIGYDLELDRAYPGGRLPLTLFWQAGGPMVRPFKVFTHLLDSEGTIQAQHDAAPGGGCCPAHTWVKGEVIVDEHPIALGADLAPGTYRLVVGMYDEDFDTRVPAYDAGGAPLAHDRVEIGELIVEAPPVEQASAIRPSPEDLDWAVFLPLVSKRASPR
jgi:uncharacterized membrane protein